MPSIYCRTITERTRISLEKPESTTRMVYHLSTIGQRRSKEKRERYEQQQPARLRYLLGIHSRSGVDAQMGTRRALH